MRGSGLEPHVVVTGQHREMLDQVNGFFGIVPDVDLDLMSHGASRQRHRPSRCCARWRPLFDDSLPDAVVVQGDTTSAFAASLAAFLAGVPVAHVEAGLRTGNLRSPFPEEANRRLTAVVAALHLAPTSTARAQPASGGGRPGQHRGHRATPSSTRCSGPSSSRSTFSDPRVAALGEERDLVLVTTHRRESWGGPDGGRHGRAG